ncbi:MAG: DUF362 domain-containing protein [Spirochaetales bacterium]|jgi:uncharacterized protein (DUF362 family)|nr:DUF362 domain-containing protein [Spirochaetales bacterium]
MEKDEIIVIYGNTPEEMAYRLAQAAELENLIGDTSKRVGLKPNLVVARPADGGATTHPEIAAGLIRYLHEKGFRNLVILEGSWVGDSTRQAFPRCGYTALAKQAGVELIDTQRDTYTSRDCKGMKIEICDSALAVDFMINLPVMKGHCQTAITCALKNNKGIMSDREKQRFHSLGLHKPIAHLNSAARNDFIVVDGICGDLDFEEGGNPIPAGRMFAARDPVLCDAWVADQMGYSLAEVPYIPMAAALGVGSSDIKKARVRELNSSKDAPLMPRPSGKARQLGSLVQEDKSCSACYAALIRALSRMSRNETARLKSPICIGQGFQGKTGEIGIGRCTKGFSASVPGCPPGAAEIMGFLRTRLS